MGSKQDADGPAVDLFGRWLEHHAGGTVPASSVAPTAGAASTSDAGPATGSPTGRHAGTSPPTERTRPRTEPEAEPEPETTLEAADAPATPRPSTTVEFSPKTGSRQVVGLLVLASLGATGVAAWLLYERTTTFNIGLTATLGVLTLVLYGVRAGAATTHLTVRGGQLEILRGGSRHVFDLSSRYSRIEEIGRPGQRGWKVAFGRYEGPPVVIDSSMVDPAEFSEVLHRYLPR